MGTKLYVSNLNSFTNEDSLGSAFSANGRVVKSVTIPSDRETGRPRGFGFVVMGSEGQAKAAIAAMDGKDLDGRVLKVTSPENQGDRAMKIEDWMNYPDALGR